MAGINPIDLQKALNGADYPASREDLARLAERNGAEDSLVGRLEALSEKQFDGPDAVSHEIFRNT